MNTKAAGGEISVRSSLILARAGTNQSSRRAVLINTPKNGTSFRTFLRRGSSLRKPRLWCNVRAVVWCGEGSGMDGHNGGCDLVLTANLCFRQFASQYPPHAMVVSTVIHIFCSTVCVCICNPSDSRVYFFALFCLISFILTLHVYSRVHSSFPPIDFSLSCRCPSSIRVD